MVQQVERGTQAFSTANTQLTTATNEITELKSKRGELELSVQMLESQQAATKAQLELAIKLLERAVDKKLEALIDDKSVVKPTYDGTNAKKFSTWTCKLKNFVCGKFPNAGSVLNWARAQDNAIVKAAAEIAKVGGLMGLNNQLFTALANLSESELSPINTTNCNGLEVSFIGDMTRRPHPASRMLLHVSSVLLQ